MVSPRPLVPAGDTGPERRAGARRLKHDATATAAVAAAYARLADSDRLLVSDVDGTLLNGPRASEGCAVLGKRLAAAGAALVLATGRDLQLTLEAVEELLAAGLPRPGALICSVGSEIYLGGTWTPDYEWAAHIAHGWDLAAVHAALADVTGLEPQPPSTQREFKASYFLPGADAAEGLTGRSGRTVVRQAVERLTQAGLRVSVIPSADKFLDVLPARASKGAAVSWLLDRTGAATGSVIVAGDSGNDREMLSGTHDGRRLKAVVVGNHEPELADFAGSSHVYVAKATFAAGVLEGIDAHGW